MLNFYLKTDKKWTKDVVVLWISRSMKAVCICMYVIVYECVCVFLCVCGVHDHYTKRTALIVKVELGVPDASCRGHQVTII
jgi:hypothetical protein